MFATIKFIWCRLFHFKEYVDISSGNPGWQVGAETSIRCGVCRRIYRFKILHYNTITGPGITRVK